MLLFVTSLHRPNLVLLSLQLVSPRLDSRLKPLLGPPGISSQVSFVIPQQLPYVALSVLGHIALLRKTRVVLGL